MNTNWLYCVHVICVSEMMSGAIQALDIAFPTDNGTPRDLNNPEFYGCKLSEDGNDPVTHYGSSFVVTEQIRQNLENAGLANTPGITYWRCSNPEGILQTTNDENNTHIGQPWSFDDCLQIKNLKTITKEYL
jgi:hypothetical protein